MLEHWMKFAEDEHEDQSLCTNGNACDHPCCPGHGDLEDSQLSEALDELVRDFLQGRQNTDTNTDHCYHFACARYAASISVSPEFCHCPFVMQIAQVCMEGAYPCCHEQPYPQFLLKSGG